MSVYKIPVMFYHIAGYYVSSFFQLLPRVLTSSCRVDNMEENVINIPADEGFGHNYKGVWPWLKFMLLTKALCNSDTM